MHVLPSGRHRPVLVPVGRLDSLYGRPCIVGLAHISVGRWPEGASSGRCLQERACFWVLQGQGIL
jgi:hypothetical protein